MASLQPQKEKLKSGKIRKRSEVEKLVILVREFETKEVVETLRPGEQFDALKVVVYDREKERDVTDELERREEEREEEGVGGGSGERAP